MTRGITGSVQTVSEAAVTRPFLLAELLFDSDPLRVWNGVGDLSWNSLTWTGIGDLGGIDVIRETNSMKAEGMVFTLSGYPTEYISIALSSDYHNRLARLYLGFMDEAGMIIPDPFVIREGLMDQMDIQEEGETSRISVRVESRLISLQRTREFLYTHEEQQALYPGDLGFEFVAGLQDKEVAWGVGVGRPGFPRYINPPPAGGGGGVGPGGPA